MVDALPHALFSGLNDFIFLYSDLQALYIILVICQSFSLNRQAWGLDATNSQWDITISEKIFLLFHQFPYCISIRKFQKYTRSYQFLLRIKLWRLLSGSPKSTLVQPYHVIRLNKQTTSVTEDGRSTSVFSLYWQLSQGRMAHSPVFIASESFQMK